MRGYSMSRTIEDVAAAAMAKGLVVRYQKANELFIDIDGLWALLVHLCLWLAFWRSCRGAVRTSTPSPSGRPFRRHVVITLPFNLPVQTRVPLQLSLGSDKVRERLSMERMRAGCTYEAVSVFFERPNTLCN
jgi:hypothetical protein